MIRRRPRKTAKGHYALLINPTARGFQPKAITRLIEAIKAKGSAYTLFEPESALEMLRMAEVAAGLRRSNQSNRPYERGGKITGLVACGGDGTFNLVARAALKADLPAGHYPLGKLNNFAHGFYGTVDPARAMEHILSSGVRRSDAANAGNLPFFSSVGLGFTERLVEEFESRPVPRFALGWSQLGARAAAQVEYHRVVLKVDAFRFEIRPAILNINLLSHSAGLPMSPASIPDDGSAEVIFDTEPEAGDISAYTRLIHKKKYLYGDQVRLYRGRVISIQPVKGRMICLDGELIDLPTDMVEIKIGDKKLQVLY